MHLRAPLVDDLEHRILFSANPLISLDSGVLSVEGTDQADSIQVREVNGSVIVQSGVGEEAERFTFDAGEVETIEFYGRDGDDRFVNNTGYRSLAFGNEGNDTLIGGFTLDDLRGGNGDDFLNGRAGDDELHGDYGNDKLVGAAGNDSLYGWFGNDELLAGSGDDYVSGYVGHDILRGGQGDDVIKGHEGNDFLAGGQGNDELYGWTGNDRLFGGAGDDSLSGYHGDDHLVGGNGDDTLKGHEGDDRLYGGQGEDRLYGWHGEDQLFGGKGDDWLSGSFGNDRVHGGEGDDEVHGGAGDDVLIGSWGNDHLVGGDGNDRLNGGQGDDRLCGGAGDDWLIGHEGNDTIMGQSGNDTLTYGYSTDAVKVDLTAGLASQEGTVGTEEINSIESVHGSRSDDFFAFSEAQAGDEFFVNGRQGFDTLSLAEFNRDDVEVTNNQVTVQLDGESFTVDFRNVERIVFADGELILQDRVTDLGGVEDGQLVSFRISGDHYDPNNLEDHGAGSPQYRISINGETFVDASGRDTFQVDASRNFVLDGDDFDGDGVTDQYQAQSRDEFELVTLRVSNDTVIESVEIQFLNDAWDGTSDNDGDNVYREDRNLVVDHLHIGGELRANGNYVGGTTIEAEDASHVEYTQNNGTDRGAREVLSWSGTLGFFTNGVPTEAEVAQPAAPQSQVVEEFVNEIFINDSRGNLASFNTDTGEFQLIGNTTTVLTDIAVSADGQIFGTSFNTLYEVDMETAELTAIATYDGVNSINALAFTQDGTLVGAGFNTTELFAINVETAGLTSLGDIGASSAGDLATHEGQLVMSTTDGRLLAIDLSTDGTATETLGNISSITYGLASQGEDELYVAQGSKLYALNDGTMAATEVTDLARFGISQVYGLSAYNEVFTQSA